MILKSYLELKVDYFPKVGLRESGDVYGRCARKNNGEKQKRDR